MAKRLTKEHLETDPLLTSYYLSVSFLKRNLRIVIALTILVILVIGGGIAYYFQSQAQEQEAQELLVFAEKAFQDGDFELALWGDERQPGLVDIITNFRRTNAGNMAQYYAAVSEAELGNYHDALMYIERFTPPKGILGVGPVSFHAVILANMQEYQRAADMFTKAAEWDINDATTPQNLLNAAQASVEAGDHGRARQLVSRILSDYEDSQIADQARRLEGMLLVMQ